MSESRIKLYCDASYYENSKGANIGIVIKQLKKELYRNSVTIPNVLDSTEAEFYAIQHGIAALKECNFEFAKVFSDNNSIIRILNGKSKCKEKYTKIVNNINAISKEMDLKFEWIPRNKNQIADSLTK